MIKLTLYDKLNNHKILGNRYYKDSELDEALDLIKDFEKDEQISVGMDPDSKDYIGYFHKRRNAKKFRAALRAAMPAEEKERLEQLIKQHKKDTAEHKKAVNIRQLEPASALVYEVHNDEREKEMGETLETPHRFSEKFEREMEELLLKFEKKRRRRDILQYAAAATVMVVCLTVTLFWASFRNARASEPGLTISAWVQDYFSFNQKGDNNQKIQFDPEQIGYIPEGFVLKEMIHSNTIIKYEYTNEHNKSFTIKVSNDSTSFQQHSEDIKTEIAINAAGYEYTYIYEKDDNYHIFMWKDESGLFYNLKGTMDKNTIVMIMDNIIYER